MARKPSRNLTDRELEIMQVFWSLGEARLGDVHDALNGQGEPVAVSTVATQLASLAAKGYLTQSGRHGRFLYAPACSREQATKNLLDDFLDRVGLSGSPAFLIQLLKAEKLSRADRAELEALLGETPKSAPRRAQAENPPAPEANP
jgi:BlaI family transcriptional regulator, penicillinase repressor